MENVHYRDLINLENFVENNSIEIEDFEVQHDDQFVESLMIK
jgi:hypothetical protein